MDNIRKSYPLGRDVTVARRGDDRLGPLQRLPGRWINAREEGKPKTGFEGRGWNMIALPFESEGTNIDYRMLVNQYNEELEFVSIDGPVPNRGINRLRNTNTDQEIFALDYQQGIRQIAVADSPATGEEIQGKVGGGIHHEPGFMMFITEEERRVDGLDIVRLASIPHGDAVTAMGRSSTIAGAPTIPQVNGLPIGATQNLSSPYLVPYTAFTGTDAFKGVEGPGFPGFDVAEPSKLLELGIGGLNVKETTELHFNTTFQTGGIVNIPFVVKQANATEMESIFWIMELEDDGNGGPGWALAYLQIVMLEFFDRFDNVPGRIKWPHVSINTMIFDEPPKETYVRMPATTS